MADTQAKANALSGLPREKLEEQALSMAKIIRTFRAENAEFRAAIVDLENRLNAQIEITADLEAANQRLQNSAKSSPFGIPSFKDLASMIAGKSPTLALFPGLHVFSVPPVDEPEHSPEIAALKNQLQKVEGDRQDALRNEAAIREFAAVLEQKLENKEAALESMQDALDSADADKRELHSEIGKSKQTIDELKITVCKFEADIASKTAVLNEAIQEKTAHLQDLSVRYAQLIEQHEILKNEKETLGISKDESNGQIESLRESLQKSMDVAKRQQLQIQKFEQEMSSMAEISRQRDSHIEGLTGVLALKESELTTLRRELSALEDRVQKGKGSAAAEARITQMQHMIEKSNALYAEMQTRAARSEARVKELERQVHQLTTPGEPTCHVRVPIGTFVLCANGRYFPGPSNGRIPQFSCSERIRTDEKNIQVDLTGEAEKDEYLKQLVLQYFRGDDGVRHQLTPIILGVLGLNEVEARAITSGDRAKNRFTFFGLI
jgi:chromosome segregation ATPase